MPRRATIRKRTTPRKRTRRNASAPPVHTRSAKDALAWETRRARGNPAQYETAYNLTLFLSLSRSLTGATVRVGSSHPVTVLDKTSKRVLIVADNYGTPVYGWVDKDAIRRTPRANPSTAAAELYESWTGEPSQHETVVEETYYDHSHLTDLARLVGFKLRGVRGQLKFRDKETRLCSNETGTQLYIRGGDQRINLDDYNTITRRPVDPTKESVVLGEIESLYYSARKPFLGKEHTKTGVYKHKLGEESGNRPFLIYDTRAGLLSISGGSYYIKPGDYDGKHSRGIVD